MSSYEVGSPKPSIHLSKSLPTPPLIQPPLLLIFVLCYSYLHMRVCVCVFMFSRLLSAVLRTSEVESRATRASLTQLLSPQMGKDIVWFLRRWAKTYLLVDEKLYEQVSSRPHPRPRANSPLASHKKG